MLDTEVALVHFFRKATDKKPYQSLSLAHGQIMMDQSQAIIDATTGEKLQYFKYQFRDATGKKKKGKPMTVIPEEREDYDIMV